MQLILARHGNTFEKGQPAVWIGKATDLPLTETGRSQAAALGERLAARGVAPGAIFCGPLQRHRQAAGIICDRLSFAPETVMVDERLTEIDYGAWEGKDEPDIRALGDGDRLDAWNSRGQWPDGAGWGETEQAMIARVGSFLGTVAERAATTSSILAITSGGVLRYFYKAARDRRPVAEIGPSKVAPGNACGLARDGADWSVLFWNARPGDTPA